MKAPGTGHRHGVIFGKLSATGPSTTAGMNERAPTRSTVPRSMKANVRLSVRKVPEEYGTRFFAARKPARAIGKTKAGNRPRSKTMPQATFQAGVLSPSPSKPDPLFAADEVNS